MKSESKKRGRGRPAQNIIEPLPASAGEVARALFRAADRKRGEEKKPSSDEPVTV